MPTSSSRRVLRPHLADCGPVIRRHFPHSAGMVSPIGDCRVHEFVKRNVPKEVWESETEGSFNVNTLTYTWKRDAGTTTLVVHEEDSKLSLLQRGENKPERLELYESRDHKHFVEARLEDDTIRSTLQRGQLPDSTLEEFRGKPFFLKGRRTTEAIEVTAENEPWPDPDPQDVEWEPFEWRETWQRPRTLNCTDVFDEHFKPFKTYIDKLRVLSIRDYRDELCSDDRTDNYEGPPEGGISVTKILTVDASIKVKQDTDRWDIEIDLNNDFGSLKLSEVSVNYLHLLNRGAHLALHEAQPRFVPIERRLRDTRTQVVSDLIGDTILFRRSLRGSAQ